jgi:hypothetical protein
MFLECDLPRQIDSEAETMGHLNVPLSCAPDAQLNFVRTIYAKAVVFLAHRAYLLRSNCGCAFKRSDSALRSASDTPKPVFGRY